MTRRIMPASWMPWPSSVNTGAPWAYMSPMSESTSPFRSLEQAPATTTRHFPTAAARAFTYSTATASSTTGLVFGMVHTAVKPPWAAAREPEAMSSFCSWPGSRKCTCMSTRPGVTILPERSRSTPFSMVRSWPTSTILPSRMRMSATSSRPIWGSIRRAFLSINAIVATS